MPQENLNHIYNAGKFFEPESEQPAKQPVHETEPSNVKRKVSVAKAFMSEQEDPFKKKVEAVLKGVEPASAKAMAGEEEKPIPTDAEVIDIEGQNYIGEDLVVGKRVRVLGDAGVEVGYKMSGGEICVEGNAGNWTGDNMSGGEIYIKGNAENWTGPFMSNGILRIDGDVGSFHKTAFCSKNKGTIIWKKQKIWENGQKVEPGWTNLDVKGKIA